MIANVLNSVGSNAIGGIIAGVVLIVLGGFFRWMRKHVADPLKEVPIIRATQLTMQTRLTSMDAKVDQHIADDARALASLSTAVKDIAAHQPVGP